MGLDAQEDESEHSFSNEDHGEGDRGVWSERRAYVHELRRGGIPLRFLSFKTKLPSDYTKNGYYRVGGAAISELAKASLDQSEALRSCLLSNWSPGESGSYVFRSLEGWVQSLHYSFSPQRAIY